MDWTTIGIIAIVVLAIAYFIFRRGRVAPQGTYDDRDVSSSGSIGGGPRAHNDPKVSSGGSLGGSSASSTGSRPRTYDSPSVSSSGSLGKQSTTNGSTRSTVTTRSRVRDNDVVNDGEDGPDFDDSDARKSRN